MDKKEITWDESLKSILPDTPKEIQEREERRKAEQEAERNAPVELGPPEMLKNLTDSFDTITDRRAENYQWDTARKSYVKRRPEAYTLEELRAANETILLHGTPVDHDVLRRFRTATLGFSREHERLALGILIEYESEFLMRRYHEIKNQFTNP